jgi:cell division protein FtsW
LPLLPTINLAALSSGAVSVLLYVLRVAVAVLCILTAVRCFTSMRLGKRRKTPIMVLEDMTTHQLFPVFYWENSIGRSRSCDIVLRDQTVSRAHAVLMRRESGWFLVDTNSKSGTYVGGKRIKERTPVFPGDVFAMGSTVVMFKRADDVGVAPPAPRRPAASPFSLMTAVLMTQIMLMLQVGFSAGKLQLKPMIPLAVLMLCELIFYFYSIKIMGHISFELETLAFLLCGVGLALQSAADLKSSITQLAAIVLGLVFFRFLIWFLGDMDRVTRWRLQIAALAILLFAANLLLAKSRNGARNWISIGPVTVQPSEFIKVAFIIVGTSTLDRLQTTKNLTGFIAFSGVCMGSLFLMRDFGTACIFFVGFLIIAFMRSGSLRTIALACSVAAFGVFLILKFKPYVAQRFEVWRHVWEHTGDAGFQQTRVLSYSASGGLFGVGLGRGCLKDVFASTSDLVFGMVCEEMGLVMALTVTFVLVFLALYARGEATRSRSALYSIAACTAGGLLLFQACLNVFGATDVLPLTGVTLPFISLGGSSMVASWGMLAFIKACDERTYGPARGRRRR